MNPSQNDSEFVDHVTERERAYETVEDRFYREQYWMDPDTSRRPVARSLSSHVGRREDPPVFGS